MPKEKTTRKAWPLACNLIKRGRFKIVLLKVSPLAQPTFALYQGKLIIFQHSTASGCLAYLEEYASTQKIA
jgi:hypothetical protein